MATDLREVARALFKTADNLWTNTALGPDEYAQPVLALIALRQMEFDAVHAELGSRTGRLAPRPEDYQARGAPYLPESARFSRLLALPGNADLGAAMPIHSRRLRNGGNLSVAYHARQRRPPRGPRNCYGCR